LIDFYLAGPLFHIDLPVQRAAAPEYLTEMFKPVTDDPGRCHLHSVAVCDIVVPQTNTKMLD